MKHNGSTYNKGHYSCPRTTDGYYPDKRDKVVGTWAIIIFLVVSVLVALGIA